MQDPASDNPLGEQSSLYLFITELGLSTRARNALLDAGISTVGDVLSVLEKGDEALINLKGFGPMSLADLKTRLQEHGFSLPDKTTTPLKALEDTLERELQELEALEMAGAAAVEAAPEEIVPEQPPAAAERAMPEEKALEEMAAPAAIPVREYTPPAETLSETPSLGQRLSATLAQPREQLRFGAWIYGVIGVVIIIILLLPPVSLLKRLGITGYTTLNAANSSTSHSDGLTMSVNPETFTDRLRVQIDSVPRLEFLEGSAGRELRKAVDALPQNLIVKSPLYQIKARDDSSQPVMIDVMVPNDAEPWETLDLYTWTGKGWTWVGSELHAEVAEHEFIRAHVTDIPDSLVVVQADPVEPNVSASLGSDDNPATTAADVLDEVNPTGLLLGTDGGFVGDPDSLLQPIEGDTYAVLPTLRNWAPGASVNRGLLSDMLAIPEIQEAHIANIVRLCIERGFAGVDVDYRGVGPDERDIYSDFISTLADALHAKELRLGVVVEPPAPTNGSWDTGGYDWAKLGAVADAIKIPFPEDPAVYVEGGQAQRLLDWATAQVDRYKLHIQVSSLSAERGGEEVNYVSLEQALAPFGEVIALNDVTRVESGSQVEFGLSSRLLSITPQEAAGTYRLEYESDDGSTHTIWLGTATNLATKLRWAQRYHLGGISVADMLDPGNGPGIVDVVRNTAAPPSETSQEMQVVWTVASETTTIDQQTSPLTEPGYTWMVLASTGEYTVKATIAGFDHGSVAIVVGEPEPEVEVAEVFTTTEAIIATEELTTTVELAIPAATLTAVTEDCLDASYVADVTIPDNTQLDNEEEFEKTWRVQNTGTCAWPKNTVIAFAGETQMDAPDSVEVGAVEPGTAVEVTVKMKAPAEAGRYTGVWQMKTGDSFFGGKLTVVILAGDVPATAAVAPVSGGSFELGGHILGYNYASQMHNAGMNWVKVQVRYPQDASGLIAEAHANGFNILLGALGSPEDVTKGNFVNDYADWFASLAAAGANAIEIWNEPNIEREWQINHIDPAAYTRLLCASYSAIKGANPNALVVSGALAPTWHNPPYHWSDQAFLQGMAAAGAASCIDYVGAHYNSGIVSPSQRSGSPQGEHYSWYFWPMVDLYYGSFGGARQVVFTEMGFLSPDGYCQLPDNFLWAADTSATEQAQWLSEAVSQAAASGKVRLIIIWNVGFIRYDCGPGNGDPQAGYSIIRPDGSCPACDSLHNILGTR